VCSSDLKDLLSAEDLAEIFETTKGTIYKEIKSGKFGEPIKIGRKYIIPKNLILEKFFKTT
jgi:predicted DNA-binding transcriptional regulator AlpA